MFILNRLTGEAALRCRRNGRYRRSTRPAIRRGRRSRFRSSRRPISRTSMTREEVNKTSPASEKACKARMRHHGPVRTVSPYGMVPSLVFPSSEGGGSWSGASFDPTRHLIVVNTRSLGTAGELRPSMSSGLLPSFGKVKIPFDDPDGYPCSAPPWGELMAINADTADIVWRVPARRVQELTKRGMPKTGTPNAGGPIRDRQLALDLHRQHDRPAVPRVRLARPARRLWSATLPNDAIATPLTYMGRNGKQLCRDSVPAAGSTISSSQPLESISTQTSSSPSSCRSDPQNRAGLINMRGVVFLGDRKLALQRVPRSRRRAKAR